VGWGQGPDVAKERSHGKGWDALAAEEEKAKAGRRAAVKHEKGKQEAQRVSAVGPVSPAAPSHGRANLKKLACLGAVSWRGDVGGRAKAAGEANRNALTAAVERPMEPISIVAHPGSPLTPLALLA
jgi:hypothetical protein